MCKSCKKLLLLAVLCLLFCPLAVSAKEADSVETEIVPYSVNGENCRAELAISGTEATITSVVVGGAGTTQVSTALVLQKYENGTWVHYASWADTVQGMSMSMKEGCQVTPGTYRVTATFTVFKGSSETVSVTTAERTCK